jgi:acyl-CoA thioester hydrolase
MQETATDASSEAGYSEGRYRQLERIWLIRASEIEYLRPIKYNDLIEVKTWILDFRRATSRRVYEFSFQSSGEMAARAYTDWVYLNSKDLQPASITQELKDAFFPEGAPDTFPRRSKFDKTPSPPDGVFKTKHKVKFLDIDQMNHVNNAVYMDYVTDCGMQVLEAYGWPWQRMKEARFVIFTRRNQIQYLQPALLDDELEIASWASNIRRSTAIRHYSIIRKKDGADIARVNARSVWVDIQNSKPIRIPANFLEDFAENLVY